MVSPGARPAHRLTCRLVDECLFPRLAEIPNPSEGVLGWWGVLITWQDVLTAWRAVEASADTPEAPDEAKRVWRAALGGWKAAQAAHFAQAGYRLLDPCPALEP